jgi:hypothetical protein
MRTPRPILLASAAAAMLIAAACNGDVTAPSSPTPVRPFFTAADTGVSSDSIIAGYGCETTGGLDYECFEYDPCTGTEYVVCPDTTTPPPPPPPPSSPTPTSPTAPK